MGEHLKVALLSVTEGEDKSLKYPVMFREANCVLITKADLLPHLPLDVELLERNIRRPIPRCCGSPPLAVWDSTSWHAWVQRQRTELMASAQHAAAVTVPR